MASSAYENKKAPSGTTVERRYVKILGALKRGSVLTSTQIKERTHGKYETLRNMEEQGLVARVGEIRSMDYGRVSWKITDAGQQYYKDKSSLP